MTIFAYSVVVVLCWFGYTEQSQLEQNITSIENILNTLTHSVLALRTDINGSLDFVKFNLNRESAFHNMMQKQLDNLTQTVVKLKNQHELDQQTMQKLEQDRDTLREDIKALQYNNSVLKLICEDDLQQLNILKSEQNNLQQELKQMALTMMDNSVVMAQANGNISNELSLISLSMQHEISQVNGSVSRLSSFMQQHGIDLANINNSFSASLQKEKNDIASINKSLTAFLKEDRRNIASINKSLSASLKKEVTNLRQQVSNNIKLVQTKLTQYIESGKGFVNYIV